jgi:hypothetical protein
VIATSAKVDLSGIDEKTVEKVSEVDYFTKEKKSQKAAKGEEAFFKQGEKPEVSNIPISVCTECPLQPTNGVGYMDQQFTLTQISNVLPCRLDQILSTIHPTQPNFKSTDA